MNQAILLAAALATNTTPGLQIRFTTPGPGSYSVQESTDLRTWRVVASGANERPVHVTAKASFGTNFFYRVEWRGR